MMKTKSYKDLEVYKLAKELAIKLHHITLAVLPKFEMYEEGSQIRRSSKSIVSNIVEGFGRRKYQKEFIMFLTYALASCDETKAHLDMLYETGNITKETHQDIYSGYEELWAKLYNFRKAVTEGHRVS